MLHNVFTQLNGDSKISSCLQSPFTNINDVIELFIRVKYISKREAIEYIMFTLLNIHSHNFLRIMYKDFYDNMIHLRSLYDEMSLHPRISQLFKLIKKSLLHLYIFLIQNYLLNFTNYIKN